MPAAGMRPRFVYALGTLDLLRPQRPWLNSERGIGGTDEAASGIGVTYEIRHDYRRTITLVYYEAEEPALFQFLRWAQINRGTSFTYHPDRNALGTSFVCYLDSPLYGEDLRGRRTDVAGVLEFEITVRRTVESPFTGVYFG